MEHMERTPARDGLAIQTGCPRCGRVDVPVRNVHLWIEHDGVSFYSFICPGCCGFVRAPADAGTMGVLLAAAPPFGQEDLAVFRRQLESDDWSKEFEIRYAPPQDPGCGRTKGPWERARTALARALTQGMGERHRLRSS